jgi:hypothetical protein
MASAFRRRYRMDLTDDVVEELLDALDEAVMLDNGRAAAARSAVLREYRSHAAVASSPG